MKLTYKQRLQQALVFFQNCDESLKEVATLFRVKTTSIQAEYNKSYTGLYTY